MKIRFLEDAQVELDEAIDFYQNEHQGLGQKFLQEILNVLPIFIKLGTRFLITRDDVVQGDFRTA